MEIKKFENKDIAFRFLNDKFYINSQEIKVINLSAEVQITIDMGGSVVIVSCSSREAEIMVKGKLNYDALQKFEV